MGQMKTGKTEHWMTTHMGTVMPFAKIAGRGMLNGVCVGLVLILAAQISFMLKINENEGVVEWLQFALLLGGAFALAIRRQPQGQALETVLRYLVVAGLFVLAMEEIDWAQPYIGYTPWSLFSDNNPYHEMALHNAFGLEGLQKYAIVFSALTGSIFMLVWVGLQRGLDGLLAFSRKTLLNPAVLVSAGILVQLAGRALHPGKFFGFDEFGELSIYAGLVLFILSRPLDGLSLFNLKPAN
jgi:DMSO reductase anchor subunit